MGLFSNNKKPCPICGNPTPRLLADKVEDMPLCKDCAAKIDLPNGALNQMSLDDFRRYLELYDENQPLRESFSETYHYGFGFLGGQLVFDCTNRLLKLRNNQSAWAIEGSQIKSFRIMEDENILFEGDCTGLRRHNNDVESRVNAMEPYIREFFMELRNYEQMEHIRELRNRDRDDDDSHLSSPPRPTFDTPAPVQHFSIDICLDHPYWSSFEQDIKAPGFDSYEPSITSYINDYRAKVEELHTLAVNLMELLAPGAPEVSVSAAAPTAAPAAAQSAPAVDVIDQLQKYKALLDQGILTEEEFTAKKKQLLGI